MKPKLKRWICAHIIGHKVDFYHTDSGYLYCQRCNSHSYYDADFDVPALFNVPFYIWRFVMRIYWRMKSEKNTLPF